MPPRDPRSAHRNSKPTSMQPRLPSGAESAHGASVCASYRLSSRSSGVIGVHSAGLFDWSRQVVASRLSNPLGRCRMICDPRKERLDPRKPAQIGPIQLRGATVAAESGTWKSYPQRRPLESLAVARPNTVHRSMALLYLVTFVSGFAALVSEVQWIRELALVLGSTVASICTVVAAFMSGLALGSGVIGRWVDRRSLFLGAYAALELGIGATAAALAFVFPWLESFYPRLAIAASGSDGLLWTLRFWKRPARRQ